MRLHEPSLLSLLPIIMSESADYWNSMMRANNMDCDAALDAIQGREYYSRTCERCGEGIYKHESVREDSNGKTIICYWCNSPETRKELGLEEE